MILMSTSALYHTVEPDVGMRCGREKKGKKVAASNHDRLKSVRIQSRCASLISVTFRFF